MNHSWRVVVTPFFLLLFLRSPLPVRILQKLSSHVLLIDPMGRVRLGVLLMIDSMGRGKLGVLLLIDPM